MSFESAKKSFDEIWNSKRELEKRAVTLMEEMKEEVNEKLVELYKPLFEKYPQIKGMRWTQYTPYFNDGDACNFSSNHYDAELIIEDEEGDLIGTNDEAYDLVDEKIIEEFQKMFPDFSKDEVETFWGDHIEVTITPFSVDVNDYDHS